MLMTCDYTNLTWLKVCQLATSSFGWICLRWKTTFGSCLRFLKVASIYWNIWRRRIVGSSIMSHALPMAVFAMYILISPLGQGNCQRRSASASVSWIIMSVTSLPHHERVNRRCSIASGVTWHMRSCFQECRAHEILVVSLCWLVYFSYVCLHCTLFNYHPVI